MSYSLYLANLRSGAGHPLAADSGLGGAAKPPVKKYKDYGKICAICSEALMNAGAQFKCADHPFWVHEQCKSKPCPLHGSSESAAAAPKSSNLDRKQNSKDPKPSTASSFAHAGDSTALTVAQVAGALAASRSHKWLAEQEQIRRQRAGNQSMASAPAASPVAVPIASASSIKVATKPSGASNFHGSPAAASASGDNKPPTGPCLPGGPVIQSERAVLPYDEMTSSPYSMVDVKRKM